MTPLTNARSQFFLATHVCLLENANSCGQNTSPPWFLVKSSIACSWTSMSQHLPTSISYTKLEIATYIHELADNYFPVLLPSIYYLVLHSLHPIVLCTRELAKITSQYDFALQNLHKVLPSTTLYYKACTKSFPVYYNLQLQNRISTPKRQKDDFEALFKKNFKRKITSTKIAKICWQIMTNHYGSLDAATPIRFTRSSCKIQYYYACSRGTEQPWRSHYNAICGEWVANQNRTTRNDVGNCSSKTGWISTPKLKKDDFEALFKRNFKRKIIIAQIATIFWKITIAAWMQPRQYDSQSSAAKDNSIAQAAAAPRLQPLYTEKHKVSCSGFLPNTKPMQHHAAIPMRSGTTASRNA